MREQLRPLVDRIVITSGTVAKFRHNPVTDRFDVMVVGVEVRPFDPAVPHQQQPITRLDHLWLLEGETAPIGSRIEAMGTPHLYARADGSIDVGIRHKPSLSLAMLREALWEGIEAGHGLYGNASLTRKALRQAEEAHGRGVLHETANELSTVASLERLRRLAARLDLNAEANLTRLASGWMPSTTTRRERRAAERQAKRRHAPIPFAGAMA
jgi:hypothetical protein